jgi:hypothetical protein
LWLADIQEQATEPLTVDVCHYTAKFSSEIASHIGRFLLEREMKSDRPCRSTFKADQPWLSGEDHATIQ